MPDFAHLPTELRPMAALDAEERIAHIRAERWIPYPTATRLLGILQEVFDQPPRERMENLLLLGESGMGKTMLIRKFERANAATFDAVVGVGRRPVVVVLMPPQPVEGEFFERVLAAVDAPLAVHWMGGRPARLRAAASQVLRELGTRVLVIDEINSVLAGTGRQQRLFLQLLRFLSNDLQLAFVCVGVPEARHVLLSDSQLRSRFSDEELPRWAPGEELRAFITRLVWSLPLRERSPVDSPKLRSLLLERTGGITLAICKAFERAAVAAVRSGREKVDLESFADPEIWHGLTVQDRHLPHQPTRPRRVALPG
jgi:hypothetical protein